MVKRGERTVLAEASVPAVSTYEHEQDYIVRVFECGWDVEFDVALLFKHAGKWLKQNKDTIAIQSVDYEYNRLTVVYRKLPAFQDQQDQAVEAAEAFETASLAGAAALRVAA